MHKLPERYWLEAAYMQDRLMQRIFDYAMLHRRDMKWKRIAYLIAYSATMRTIIRDLKQ